MVAELSQEFHSVVDLFFRKRSAVILFCLLIAACAAPSGNIVAGPQTPGWTGTQIVPGNNSTIAGDAQATYLQQKWPLGPRP